MAAAGDDHRPQVLFEVRRQLARKRSAANECRLENVRDYVGVEPAPEFSVKVVSGVEHLVTRLLTAVAYLDGCVRSGCLHAPGKFVGTN